MNKEIIIEGLVEQVFNVGSERTKRDAAKIVYDWYENENTFSDFTSEQEFINFVGVDIFDMLNLVTNPDEVQLVNAVLFQL